MQRLHVSSRRISFIVFFFLLTLLSQRAAAVDHTFQYRYNIPGVVSISGNTALAWEDSSGSLTLHSLLLNDYGWIYQETLTPDRPLAAHERFLYRGVFIDGDTAAVATNGDCGDFGNPVTNSAVFIFKRTGSTWSQQQEITFGCADARSIAFEDNRLVVSKETPVFIEDEGAHASYLHSAAIYEFNGSSWTNVANIDLDADDCVCINYDADLVISGDLILSVGGSSSTVEVRVIRRTGGVWSQQTTLPFSTTFPEFDVDGSTAIVGENVYVTDGTNWTLQTTFDLETASGLYTGNIISVEGDYALVRDNIDYWLMVRNGTTWSQEVISRTPEQYVGLLQLSGNRALVGNALMSRGPVPNEVPFATQYFLSGNTVLFHDPLQEYYQNPDYESGTVYVRNSSSIWEKQAAIQTNGEPKALQGDTAVFTTYGQDDHSPEPIPNIDGTLTVFKRNGTTWTPQQTLEFNPNFGTDVDIDGNTILVSDPGQYDSYTRSIIFIEYNGTTWQPTESFDVDNGPGGAEVALSGDLALATVEVGNDGYFRTFQHINGVWTEVAQLDPDIMGKFDLSGNTAIVENRVYVFDGTDWMLQATLIPNEPVSGRLLGAIDGNTVVLASEFKSFVFTRSGNTWTQQQKLMIGGLDIGYEPLDGYFPYGYSINVELSGNVALVRRYTFDIGGAPGDSTPTPVVTDEVPLPTAQPTEEPTSGPTSTPQSPDAPLNKNTSFEDNGLSGWVVKNGSGDKLVCNTDKVVAHSGNCAFKFKNIENESGKLQQIINFASRTSLMGSSIELSLFARTKANATGTAKVVVKYTDGSKQKFDVDLADASVYTQFTQRAPLTQAVNKAKIVIKGTNAKGKFYVDDVTLRYVEGTSGFSVLPLP
jgi:hypothetical protein